MRQKYYVNHDWKFSASFCTEMTEPDFDDNSFETVNIPHSVTVTPYNCFDESSYQFLSCYRRLINIPAEFKGKICKLTFEGAAHRTMVYINGKKTLTHPCGYTAFTIDITDYVNYGEDNLIAVSLDSRETLNQPPFGHVIDYMTYGGIYRDVYITIYDPYYIKDVFMYSDCGDSESFLCQDIYVTNPGQKILTVKTFLDGIDLGSWNIRGDNYVSIRAGVGNITKWDIDNPKLYSVKTAIYEDGKLLDERTDSFGFRKSEFRSDGYYLNGRKVRLTGLNRHQSYPYVGYAMPASMQMADADMLKRELGVNAVRTSHYPQSQDFIRRCDELGLLVFTEIPGWQYIGDGEWQDIAVNNVRDMVVQYRNHPSVILWGVRINESVDNDAFYKKTNETAHTYDSTRPTGGVRAGKKGSFLEDVYTYNDFSHDGKAAGCEPKRKVTPDTSKTYFISEFNGHMFPTKAFDCEAHRLEHALRHANVLDAVAGQSDIAGCFGWCMFDYNTHKDFGSGDRICYHGVMDMFRNPKMAAGVYASNGLVEPVLEISSTMDIGEHPGCNRGDTWIFTNADSVKMYKNDTLIKEYKSEESSYVNLKRGPIRVDDYVGNTIVEGENFKPRQAALVKELMNATAIYGLTNLPKSIWVKAAWLMLVYRMSFDDATRLYTQYVGNWGTDATVYKFEAIRDGKVVKTVTKAPSKSVKLWAVALNNELTIGRTYDVTEVRIRALDDFGNISNCFNEPVSISVLGPFEIIGPNVLSLKGGMGGVYVKSVGNSAGSGTLTVSNPQCEPVTLELKLKTEDVSKL